MIIESALTFSNKRYRSQLSPSSSSSLILCLSGRSSSQAQSPWGAERQLFMSRKSTHMRILVSWQDCKFYSSEYICPSPCWSPGSQPRAWHRERIRLIFVKWMNEWSCHRCAPREPILQCLSLLSLARDGLKLSLGKDSICPTPT